MTRLPNHYESTEADTRTVTVIDNTEFSDFVTGQSDKVSPDMRKKVKLAMKDMDVKMNVFFMAYAQKSVHRLSRLMRALDGVDRELLQEYRLSAMSTEDLTDLFSELNVEKHRSSKELLVLSEKLSGNSPDLNTLFPDEDPDESVRLLPKASKRKITEFFKSKVVSK